MGEEKRINARNDWVDKIEPVQRITKEYLIQEFFINNINQV